MTMIHYILSGQQTKGILCYPVLNVENIIIIVPIQKMIMSVFEDSFLNSESTDAINVVTKAGKRHVHWIKAHL